MKSWRCLMLVILCFMAVNAVAQAVQTDEQPTESAHRRGPHGLEGWTLSFTIYTNSSDRYPMSLMLARRGHVFRRISGSPFLWSWIFWDGGRQVAYEAGPLHFGMTCILKDVATGRELASYDCYHPLPDPAPDWVKALESARQ